VTRLALTFVVLSAIAGLVALPVDAGADRLSFVQVVEKEYTLTPSRPSVRTGSVSLELVNFGMDNHDLVIKSAKPGTTPVRFKQLAPLGRAERTLKLPDSSVHRAISRGAGRAAPLESRVRTSPRGSREHRTARPRRRRRRAHAPTRREVGRPGTSR
jgi:hypothetical protein